MSVLERTDLHPEVQVFALMEPTAFQSAFIISREANSNRQLICMEIEYIIFSLRCGLDYFGTTSSGKLKFSLFAYLYMVKKDAASINPPFSWDSNKVAVPVILTLISIWSHFLVQLYENYDFHV